MHKTGHFSGTGGTVVGPTIQEADRIYLVDASARDQNDRSANGYVSGSERGERNGQTASLKRACVLDRLAVTRQAAPRGNGIQKANLCT